MKGVGLNLGGTWCSPAGGIRATQGCKTRFTLQDKPGPVDVDLAQMTMPSTIAEHTLPGCGHGSRGSMPWRASLGSISSNDTAQSPGPSARSTGDPAEARSPRRRCASSGSGLSGGGSVARLSKLGWLSRSQSSGSSLGAAIGPYRELVARRLTRSVTSRIDSVGSGTDGREPMPWRASLGSISSSDTAPPSSSHSARGTGDPAKARSLRHGPVPSCGRLGDHGSRALRSSRNWIVRNESSSSGLGGHGPMARRATLGKISHKEIARGVLIRSSLCNYSPGTTATNTLVSVDL